MRSLLEMNGPGWSMEGFVCDRLRDFSTPMSLASFLTCSRSRRLVNARSRRCEREVDIDQYDGIRIDNGCYERFESMDKTACIF